MVSCACVDTDCDRILGSNLWMSRGQTTRALTHTGWCKARPERSPKTILRDTKKPVRPEDSEWRRVLDVLLEALARQPGTETTLLSLLPHAFDAGLVRGDAQGAARERRELLSFIVSNREEVTVEHIIYQLESDVRREAH